MTDTNQASEDELQANVLEIIESHFKPTGYSLMPLNATKRIMQLIRTEKLKLLAEVRERVVDKPTGNHNADSLLERDVLIYNQATAYLRTELTKLKAEL